MHFPFDERGCGGEQMKQEKTLTIPLDKRVYLSLEEAMSYTGLDEKTLRKLSDGIYNSFVLWAGRRRLLKRQNMREVQAAQRVENAAQAPAFAASGMGVGYRRHRDSGRPSKQQPSHY